MPISELFIKVSLTIKFYQKKCFMSTEKRITKNKMSLSETKNDTADYTVHR